MKIQQKHTINYLLIWPKFSLILSIFFILFFIFFAELVTKPRLLLKLEFKTKRHKKTYKHISIGFLAFDLFYPQNDMLWHSTIRKYISWIEKVLVKNMFQYFFFKFKAFPLFWGRVKWTVETADNLWRTITLKNISIWLINFWFEYMYIYYCLLHLFSV